MNRLITLPELFDSLRPYQGAGLSALRWYDASVEATFYRTAKADLLVLQPPAVSQVLQFSASVMQIPVIA